MINVHGQKSLPSAFFKFEIKVAIVLVWMNFSIKLNKRKVSDKRTQDKIHINVRKSSFDIFEF